MDIYRRSVRLNKNYYLKVKINSIVQQFYSIISLVNIVLKTNAKLM